MNKWALLNIVGLLFVVAFILAIMAVWVSANTNNEIYFSAGEPNLAVKYGEWIMTGFGIIIVLNIIRKEFKKLHEE